MTPTTKEGRGAPGTLGAQSPTPDLGPSEPAGEARNIYPSLVMGGQGRTDSEVEADARALVTFLLGVAIGALFCFGLEWALGAAGLPR